MMKSDYENIIIIEDDIEDDIEYDIEDDIENNIEEDIEQVEKVGKKKEKKIMQPLKKWYVDDKEIYEIGVDEAGRGPLFGRVYAAAVILPKDDIFHYFQMKDSKKFHSKKKIEEVANYIKENAIAWYVSFEDEKSIDEINILQATQKAMHDAIKNVRNQFIHSIQYKKKASFHLLIDGNYFNPFKVVSNNKIDFIPHVCVEGGDNKYSSIAAASILAKVSRDHYIEELVKENPELAERYAIDSNKGYGAKKHLDGIKEFGITEWHRKTFGICKSFV